MSAVQHHNHNIATYSLHIIISQTLSHTVTTCTRLLGSSQSRNECIIANHLLYIANLFNNNNKNQQSASVC